VWPRPSRIVASILSRAEPFALPAVWQRKRRQDRARRPAVACTDEGSGTLGGWIERLKFVQQYVPLGRADIQVKVRCGQVHGRQVAGSIATHQSRRIDGAWAGSRNTGGGACGHRPLIAASRRTIWNLTLVKPAVTNPTDQAGYSLSPTHICENLVLAAGIARQPHSRLVRIGILGKQIAAVECGSSDADSVDHEGMRRRSPIACRQPSMYSLLETQEYSVR